MDVIAFAYIAVGSFLAGGICGLLGAWRMVERARKRRSTPVLRVLRDAEEVAGRATGGRW